MTKLTIKKTKDVILDTALELFNTKGLAKVTLRTIAQEMNISQGNLTYHYKKREQIIEALYFQLVSNIDKSFSNIENSEHEPKSLLHVLLTISDTIMMNFYDYRFIMIDFVHIIRNHEQIHSHYRQLVQQREKQFFVLLDMLIEQGILRAATLENEYQNLYKRTQIMGNFWISHIITTGSDEVCTADMDKYSEIINQNIYPYLTEKGREHYSDYVVNKCSYV